MSIKLSRWMIAALIGFGLVLAIGACSEEEEEPKQSGTWITSDNSWDWAFFGQRLALDGDNLAVIAPGGSSQATNPSLSGLFTFTRDSATGAWTETGFNSVSTAGDSFGDSVAISGDQVMVGSRLFDVNPATDPNSNEGAVYFYTRGVTQGSLVLSKVIAGAGFLGGKVSMEGDVALASGQIGGVSGSGLLVFERDAGTRVWGMTGNIPNTVGVASLAQSGNLAIIGSISGNGPSNVTGSGVALVYQRDPGTGAWSEVAQLEADTPLAGQEFGYGVEIDGSYAAISTYSGSTGAETAFGEVYIFEDVGGTWTQVAKFTGDESAGLNYYGRSMALHGDRLLVSDTPQTGQAVQPVVLHEYRRDATSGVWSETNVLTTLNQSYQDSEGLDFSATEILIGEKSRYNMFAGAVNVMALP